MLSGPHHQKILIIVFINSQLTQVHSEVEASFIEHLLDLGKRLLAEVAELHQVFLLILNQLAERVDLGGALFYDRGC